MNRRGFLRWMVGAAGLIVAEQLVQPTKIIFDYGAIAKRSDIKVYVDPCTSSDVTKHMGFIGVTKINCGVFYCPYVPVFVS